MSSPGVLPLNMTSAGPVPTSPINLLAALVANVLAINPDFTANLPGSLIEDLTDTQVGGLALMDSARVDLINSLTPFAANPFLLVQLGQMLGLPIGLQTNTSVYVVFSGPPGFTIPKGFVVSDTSFNYQVQDGGVINTDGSSDPLFCVATVQGTWGVPAGTVVRIVTSVPDSVTLTCTNPNTGVPGIASGESEENYRTRLQQANLATAQGATRFLKTILGQVSGVQQRLISVRQQSSGWEIIVGGGDPYAVANAIFQSLFNINTLVGSTINVLAITKATNAQITTDLNHGLTVGQNNIHVAGVLGMTAINGGPYTVVAVVDEKNFTVNVNSTGFATYTSGGVITPNNRNISVTISDPPDTYVIPFVDPPAQTVTMTITWNTTSTNIVPNAAMSSLAAPALVDYVNGISVGQPMNLFELQAVFQQATAPLLDPNLLTRMVFSVAINGVTTAPAVGTGIIAGDPESYFEMIVAGVTLIQG